MASTRAVTPAAISAESEACGLPTTHAHAGCKMYSRISSCHCAHDIPSTAGYCKSTSTLAWRLAISASPPTPRGPYKKCSITSETTASVGLRSRSSRILRRRRWMTTRIRSASKSSIAARRVSKKRVGIWSIVSHAASSNQTWW